MTDPPPLVLAAERACVAMSRLDADATEGAPVWEWTADEADREVRALLSARDALGDAVDEHMRVAEELADVAPSADDGSPTHEDWLRATVHLGSVGAACAWALDELRSLREQRDWYLTLLRVLPDWAHDCGQVVKAADDLEIGLASEVAAGLAAEIESVARRHHAATEQESVDG